MAATSVEKALQGAFGPINEAPTIADGSIGTTAALLVADKTADSLRGIRRVMITNTHASNTLTLILKTKGWSPGAETVADGARIPAGSFRTFLVSYGLSIGIVASGASTTYNAIISDI